MPPEKGDRAYVEDMLEFARQVIEFTGGFNRKAYGETLIVRRAVERTDGFRESHPEIP